MSTDQRSEVPEECIRLIKKWEGFSSTWYKDAGGVPTIGYGFTKWTPGVEISNIPSPLPETVADSILREVIRQHYAPGVQKGVRDWIVVCGYQLGALVSFAYNVGLQAWESSTLREHVNDGASLKVGAELMEWIYVDGKIVPGLINRRRAERKMWKNDAHGALRVQAEEVPTYPPTTFSGAKATLEKKAEDEAEYPLEKMHTGKSPTERGA